MNKFNYNALIMVAGVLSVFNYTAFAADSDDSQGSQNNQVVSNCQKVSGEKCDRNNTVAPDSANQTPGYSYGSSLNANQDNNDQNAQASTSSTSQSTGGATNKVKNDNNYGAASQTNANTLQGSATTNNNASSKSSK